ncbi:MAG: hypothetical protein Q8O88_01400 [bacterium]|nr:hypothetical protein [bacterium]
MIEIQTPSIKADIETQFASPVEDAKPVTQPSIIVEGGLQQIGLKKLKPEDIEKFLLMHPLVARGIEIRANRIISRGYEIKPVNKSQQAKRAAKEMSDLMENSGGVILLKNWIQNTYGFGNGYLTLVPNTKGNKIVMLRQEHPIFFRIARHKLTDNERQKKAQYEFGLYGPAQTDNFYYGYGTLKIDPITKRPSAYTQVKYDASKQYVVPFGPELKTDEVAHLVFDTWGDEIDGISVIQYIHLLIKYLLNLENAAAENIFRHGFTQKKITTEIMTERDLREISKNVKDINAKDAIILPKGVNLENLIPGQTQFPAIHDKFMTLIAIRLGVPKPILTLDGTEINKATMDELTKDMMKELYADELKISKIIETHIFIPACQKLFGDNFSQYPKFQFNPFTESEDMKAARQFRIAQTLDAIGRTVNTLIQAGYTERAEQVLKFIDEVIPKSDVQGFREDEPNKSEKRDTETKTPSRAVEDPLGDSTHTVGRPDGTNVDNVRGKKIKPTPTTPTV